MKANSAAGKPVQSSAEAPFPIVGIGASAGGLEAYRELLRHLPLDTGMAFVLVQHLDPEHESALTTLLSRATRLPVLEVTQKLRIKPNRVYVIPPNTQLGIERGVLKLAPRTRSRTPHHPINYFFEALSQDQRECAIGVVLSGTATDGTVGLEAIKAEGGITFAQDDSARYDSMPRSAVAAGCADFVLSPRQIAQELTRIAQHPYLIGQAGEPGSPEDDRAQATLHAKDATPLPSGGHGSPVTDSKKARAEAHLPAQAADGGYKKILLLLRHHSGVDFSLYKSTTIQRRINRRILLTKHAGLDEYSGFLRGNAKELDALYSDVLISVTSFFRNPEAFDVLQRKVFPALLKQRSDEPLRTWVLGCSTGQEAYSIAMSFTEASDKVTRARRLQIFATDLNDALLDKARHGLYAKTLEQDISPERLRRFFVEEEGGYRVIKPLREMVVFARQNLIDDPPFSRMDLISCRNLLIYLEPGLQKKAMPTFHYALKPEGFLFLGASESVSGFTELFAPLDKKHKIFSKKAAPAAGFQLPVKKDKVQPGAPEAPGYGPSQRGKKRQLLVGAFEAPDGFRSELSAQREADRVSVNQFAPPAVLINDELQILQFRGPTGAYLEPPSGKASFDLLKMARDGLMLPLRAAISQARKDNKTARKANIRLSGSAKRVSVEVIPLKNLRERCFLVLFKNPKTAGGAAAAASVRAALPAAKEGSRRFRELESDLAEARDFLQSMQEQHEAANEELQASSEEVQSANEELQSVNEELETSKEELESANEELTTVNEEMANRNAELSRLNSDLTNLQASTQLAIVLLGRDLTIRRFSPQAEKQFSLLAADLGRPIGHIRHTLEVPQLEDLISEVISSVHETERDVQDNRGHWYSLRVRPYLSSDNKVDGAVLVLVDITERMRLVDALREHAENLANIAHRKDEFLAMLSHELRGPLAPLSNALEILQRAGDGNGDAQQARGIAQRQLEHLVRLVDDLLDASRISSGKVTLHRQHVELAPVVQRALETCRPAINRARHDVTVTLPPEPLYLNADPVRLAQVFSNLLTNACKYTEPGGRISLTVERHGNEAVISVKDSGIGIAAEMLPKLFELFSQEDNALERIHGGLGIGLSVVQRMVSMHGGTVEARSAGKAKGSEFVVRLPLVDGMQDAKLVAPSPPIPDAGAETKRSILIVDDNRDSTATLAMWLKLMGHPTHIAHDGLEAVVAAEKLKPDVVLMDLGMPKLNGFEAARKIRSEPWGKHMVLVALTGWGQDDDRRKTKEAGFDGHLVKPVDYAALMKVIGAHGTPE